MNPSCPINTKIIDSTTIRINSILNSLLMLSVIVLNKYLFIAILVLDFAIKLKNPECSPFTKASKYIRDIFHIEAKMINSAPKRFAMKMGFSFSLLLTLLAVFSFAESTLFILSAIFLTFMFLEWALDYCVGCKIYALIQYFKI